MNKPIMPSVVLLALQLLLTLEFLCLPEAGEAHGGYKCSVKGCEKLSFRTEVDLRKHNSHVHLGRKHTYGGSSGAGTSSSAPKRQNVGNVGTSQPAAGAGSSSTAPKRPTPIRHMGPHQKPPPIRPDMNDPLNHGNNSAFKYKGTK